jgi:hypothetical protein
VRARTLSRLIAALLVLAAAAPAGALTFNILNGDSPGEGFNDPTPVAPVPGNGGTTRGQQRQNAFLAAAAYWATRLVSVPPVNVVAQINPLPCTPTSGVLGAAGPINYFANFPAAPQTGTWYPSALANRLQGADLAPAEPEITAQFNSLLDSDPSCLGGLDWYGVGGAAPPGTRSFYEVVVHELAHGLGFLTIVNLATGARANNFNDAYMLLLEDHSTGKTWPQMNNAERAASAIDTGDLHWTGAAVQAASGVLNAGRHPTGHVRMYAPAPVASGSSVSHWDTVVASDELMEPFATPNPLDLLTTRLLQDIGWGLQAGACVRAADTACLLRGRFEVEVDWQTAAPSAGAAQVMHFGGQRSENDESVFFWFFGAANFEMGVKLLDACVPPFNKFWVFVSGLTNQGWTVQVRDTQTGATKTYNNPVNQLSTTFADTAAFDCP